MSFDRNKFVDDLRALVKRGVVFRHQGRNPETGLDCINAPAWAYKEQGLPFPAELDEEMKTYPEESDGWHMLEVLRQWFIEVPVVDNKVPEAISGDLLLCYAYRNPRHMAVIVKTEPLTVIEAYRSPSNKIGKLIEQPFDWRRRICACFRIPDFE